MALEDFETTSRVCLSSLDATFLSIFSSDATRLLLKKESGVTFKMPMTLGVFRSMSLPLQLIVLFKEYFF